MSYQEPFVLSISLLCFQIFVVKLISWPKMGQTYAISIVNWSFGKIVLENFFFFFFFFMDFTLLMFHIVKISEILKKGNLLITCLKFTYPINFCIFFCHFYNGKIENTRFLAHLRQRLRMSYYGHLPSIVRPLSPPLNDFFTEPLSQFSSNFMWSLLLKRN